jgi:hypothetical protein
MEVHGSTYIIPVENMPELRERIGKLNKRAKRLSLQPIRLIEGAEVVVEKRLTTLLSGTEQSSRMVKVKCIEVTVIGEKPQLGNYRLVARVQLVDDVSFLHLVPGETLPVQYHEVHNQCDHCGVKRQRNDVYVLRDATTEEIKVVGSTCIQDFLPGKTPQQMAWYAESLAFLDLREHEEYGERDASFFLNSFDVAEYLACAACAIRNFGWKSKAYANATEGREISTSSTASSIYDKRIKVEVMPEDILLADNAIAWIDALDAGTSDYLINCKKVVEISFAPWNLSGIAASIIAAYQREQGKLAEAAKARAASHHVGKVKERLTLDLVVTRTLPILGSYGTSYLHMFRDETGNVYKWFSTRERLEQGEKYKIVGTVKSHEEYEGIAQTQLTRCKVK